MYDDCDCEGNDGYAFQEIAPVFDSIENIEYILTQTEIASLSGNQYELGILKNKLEDEIRVLITAKDKVQNSNYE